jgi:hypothetical protein
VIGGIAVSAMMEMKQLNRVVSLILKSRKNNICIMRNAIFLETAIRQIRDAKCVRGDDEVMLTDHFDINGWI